MRRFHFADALLAWFDRAGRKHLPWQQQVTPYRVWVSEIMLQQTQVTTVIPFFDRFIQAFPNITSLAHAPLDQVLAHWTGLGYYARARHLHKAAQHICLQYHGDMPCDLHALMALPGIGRSTAGAILALGFGQHASILDGNVKRVLTRFHAVPGWPGNKAVAEQLWAYAEHHTPTQRTAEYTQAIMDLGAMVCTRSKPDCLACPLRAACQAHQQGTPTAYPSKRPTKTLPSRATQLLLIRNRHGDVLLEQRPPTGLWGGLWCFPEAASEDDAAAACWQRCRGTVAEQAALPAWRHTFSHYHLDIRPVLLRVHGRLRTPANTQWIQPATALRTLGMATPTCRLLEQLTAC